MPLEHEILDHIRQQAQHRAGFKQLVRELGVPGVERRQFANRLERLVQRGELVEVADQKYALPDSLVRQNVVIGRLSMHRDGYGFVIPESTSVRDRLAGDIFIPVPAIGSAMHGDRVLVEMGAIRPDGRAEGVILRVVGRAHPTVVGTFHYGQKFNYVRPIDEKITQDIIIPRGMEIPPELKANVSPAVGSGPRRPGPISEHGRVPRDRVLGTEARRTIAFQDLENVVVDVEISDWPTATQNPRGRVVEILGCEDDFGVDVEIIIRKYHLPHRFPAEVIDEAQSIDNVIPQYEIRARHDYRSLSIVTIDGETARDFDDAVAVRRLANGNFELQVHIADVAHYVTENSSLDKEARLRGTSVYFPDRAVPMLPVELSTDICSLRPRLDRLVMSCVMEIDHAGEVVGYELHEGVIRSAERMTYTDVNLMLEGDTGLRKRYHKLVEGVELMRELALILSRKRVRRGSIDFDLPEPVIEFSEEGLMQGITRSERNIAHRMIEEFMLAANESVASYLEQNGVPSIYRIHEKPDPKKVYEFETIAATFGYSLGVGALPVKRLQMHTERRSRHDSRRQHTLELPQEVHVTPRMYQKLAQKITGKPEERILSYLMLRSLKQARYSERNVGHFALAAPTYTHFTSPIRRYPDLIVHRILKQLLREGVQNYRRERTAGSHEGRPRGGQSRARAQTSEAHSAATDLGPIPQEVLHEIAEESSEAERRADDAERELMEWKKIRFMEDRLGEEFDALVVSVTKYGFFVELIDMFIEGLVPLSSLMDDRYTYRENTKQIIGEQTKKKYSLGDRVRVLLDRIDHVQHKLQFAVVEARPSRAQRKHRS